MSSKCIIPGCLLISVSSTGHCVTHHRMPFYPGMTISFYADRNTKNYIETRVIAEVDHNRRMFRLRGDQGWRFPGDFLFTKITNLKNLQS